MAGKMLNMLVGMKVKTIKTITVPGGGWGTRRPDVKIPRGTKGFIYSVKRDGTSCVVDFGQWTYGRWMCLPNEIRPA